MPNRIIKESICTSDSLSQLTDFQEAFFYRLIVNCDDYGRMDARPAILKARLYPLRERLTLKEVEGALRALATVGCVEVYEIDGKPFLRLPSWEVHQQIRAKKSKYPAPDRICNQMISDDIKCPRNPIQSESESNPNPKPNPTRAGAHDPAVAAVSSAFLDRINPSASQASLEELAEYAREMGAEVCLRAMDIALDAKAPKWPYIKAILSKWQSLGVKCLADIERLDKKPVAGKQGKAGKGFAGSSYDKPETQARMRKDMEWMKRFAAESEGGEVSALGSTLTTPGSTPKCAEKTPTNCTSLPLRP